MPAAVPWIENLTVVAEGLALDRVCEICGRRDGDHSVADECPGRDGEWLTSRFTHSGVYETENGERYRVRGEAIDVVAPPSTLTLEGMSAAYTMSTATETISEERREGQSMGWLMIPHSDVLMLKLQELRIPVIPQHITEPREMVGMAFPEENLEQVLQLVEIEGEPRDTDLVGVRAYAGSVRWREGQAPRGTEEREIREEGSLSAQEILTRMAREAGRRTASRTGGTSTILGYELVTDPSGGGEAEVASPRFVVKAQPPSNLESWDQMRPVLQKYANALKVNIRVLNTHGSADRQDHGQPGEGWMRIQCWSAVRMNFGSHSYEGRYAWGIPIADGQQDGVSASGLADREIVCPEGWVVAEVEGKILHILFDLPHPSGNPGGLLECIMEAYAKIVNMPPEEAEVQAMRKLAELMNMAQKKKIMELESNIAAQRRQIVDYENAMKNYYAEIANALPVLQALKASINSEEDLKKAKERLAEIKKIAGVVNVEVAGQQLNVYTEQIDFMWEKGLYRGYEYKIVLDPYKGQITIKAAKKVPLVAGYAHPHVRGDSGVPCLGNIQKGAYLMLSQLEFAPLVALLITYLGEANKTDWYRDPTGWPKLSGAELEVAKERRKAREEGRPAVVGQGGAAGSEAATIVEPGGVASATTVGVAAEPPVNAVTSVNAIETCPSCGVEMTEGVEICEECGLCENCCDFDHSNDVDEEENG